MCHFFGKMEARNDVMTSKMMKKSSLNELTCYVGGHVCCLLICGNTPLFTVVLKYVILTHAQLARGWAGQTNVTNLVRNSMLPLSELFWQLQRVNHKVTDMTEIVSNVLLQAALVDVACNVCTAGTWRRSEISQQT